MTLKNDMVNNNMAIKENSTRIIRQCRQMMEEMGQEKQIADIGKKMFP